MLSAMSTIPVTDTEAIQKITSALDEARKEALSQIDGQIGETTGETRAALEMLREQTEECEFWCDVATQLSEAIGQALKSPWREREILAKALRESAALVVSRAARGGRIGG